MEQTVPGPGRSLNGLAVSATVHCLTGCAIGEVLGLAIGTAAGLGNGQTIALAVVLAFVFGYGLTARPPAALRHGPLGRRSRSRWPPTRSRSS